VKEANTLRFVCFIEKRFYHRRVVTENEDHCGVKEIDGKLNLCGAYLNELGEYVFLPISVDVSDPVNLITDNNGKIENDEFIGGIVSMKYYENEAVMESKMLPTDIKIDFYTKRNQKACEGEF
jgi:hypothetical protein